LSACTQEKARGFKKTTTTAAVKYLYDDQIERERERERERKKKKPKNL
jgi:hypothetical protein